MTLLEKLGKARIDFQVAGIKKTGRNNFVGFEYYELHDIIPKINELSNIHRFICVVSFTTDMATLTITDIDDPAQTIQFTSPMAGINLKGAHDIQNMGAVQTYMRRYLYMMAFEIVECDAVDGGMGKKPDKNIPSSSKPNVNQDDNHLYEKGLQMENERKLLGQEISVVLKTMNPDKLPYFTEFELAHERAIFNGALDVKSIRLQYDRLKNTLEKRKAEYKPIPFDDTPAMYSEEEPEFKDDVPGENKEQSNKNLEIF